MESSRSRSRSQSRHRSRSRSRSRVQSTSMAQEKRSSSTDKRSRPLVATIVADNLATDSLPQYCHVHPAHSTETVSLLSSESASPSFRGFYNLAVLLVFVSTVRMMLENYRKYGLLFSYPFSDVPLIDMGWLLVWGCIMFAFITVSIALEKMSAVDRVPSSHLYRCMCVNVALSILIPSALCWTCVSHFVVSFLIIFHSLISTMKLISYHCVNQGLKSERQSEKTQSYPECPYPQNLTFGNMIYFWFAPTLCYQPIYPRTSAIRWKFLLKRLLELLITCSAMCFALMQYVIPTAMNTVKPLEESDFLSIIDRLLKFSISTSFCWVALFYVYFHVYLNTVAELLKFGDRSFYLQWWNATSIEEFWRLWNLPVHTWFKRHVYVPLRRTGMSPVVSGLTTFCLSALMHELVACISLHIVRFWFFMTILFQVPLIILTRWSIKRSVSASSFNNILFWIVICLIQPSVMMLYFYAWIKS